MLRRFWYQPERDTPYGKRPLGPEALTNAPSKIFGGIMIGTTEHRNRKNPKSAEAYKELRKQRNDLRPKQVVIHERQPNGSLKATGPFRA